VPCVACLQAELLRLSAAYLRATFAASRAPLPGVAVGPRLAGPATPSGGQRRADGCRSGDGGATEVPRRLHSRRRRGNGYERRCAQECHKDWAMSLQGSLSVRGEAASPGGRWALGTASTVPPGTRAPRWAKGILDAGDV
jgi:hypothetical protein